MVAYILKPAWLVLYYVGDKQCPVPGAPHLQGKTPMFEGTMLRYNIRIPEGRYRLHREASTWVLSKYLTPNYVDRNPTLIVRASDYRDDASPPHNCEMLWGVRGGGAYFSSSQMRLVMQHNYSIQRTWTRLRHCDCSPRTKNVVMTMLLCGARLRDRESESTPSLPTEMWFAILKFIPKR